MWKTLREPFRTGLRLSRSKKNAHSKGYAYIEFELREVAEIVAKEMNKYYIMSQQIVGDPSQMQERKAIPLPNSFHTTLASL